MNEKRPVEFTEVVSVKDHNGRVIFRAEKGDIVNLPGHSADRWIRRGKAIEAKAPVKKASKKKAVKAEG